MKLWKNVVVVVAAVGATTLLTQRVVSQDYKKELEQLLSTDNKKS